GEGRSNARGPPGSAGGRDDASPLGWLIVGRVVIVAGNVAILGLEIATLTTWIFRAIGPGLTQGNSRRDRSAVASLPYARSVLTRPASRSMPPPKVPRSCSGTVADATATLRVVGVRTVGRPASTG